MFCCKRRLLVSIAIIVLLFVSWATLALISKGGQESSDFYAEPESYGAIAGEAEPVYENGADDGALGPYQVVDVVDGDTIKIYRDGCTETVRLIGIDSPEMSEEEDEVECFAEESRGKLVDMILDHGVYVKFDETQNKQDRFGRQLMYVWRADDEIFINAFMVRNGYAIEYTYDDPYEYHPNFKVSQSKAIEEGLGLWSACE